MERTPRSRGRHPKHPVLHLGGNQPHMGRIHVHSGLNKGPLGPLIPPGPPGPLIPPGPPGPLIPPGPLGPLIPPGPLTLLTSFAPKRFGPFDESASSVSESLAGQQCRRSLIGVCERDFMHTNRVNCHGPVWRYWLNTSGRYTA